MDFIRRFLPGGVSQKVEQYLEGVEFPLDKEQLVSKLEENGAPGVVVNQLNQRLPEGEYSSAREIVDAIRQR